jgi:hypothetical protein
MFDDHPDHWKRTKSPARFAVELLDRNAREAESINRFLKSSLEQERDEWKARALEAEARLARIQSNVLSLLDIH